MANMRLYEPVTYMTPSSTSGCVSCPRIFSPPNEKAQAGTRRETFSLVISFNGLKR
jgi:hypothetical protein